MSASLTLPTRSWPWRGRLQDYLELTKPEVTSLVLVSTAAGFFLGSPPEFPWVLLLHTLVGTALVASGTATLNMFAERSADARMRRTAQRPLPAGRLHPSEALLYGLLLAVTGGAYLYLLVNPFSSFLALLTLVTYLLCYTPLKSRTVLCTLVGAVPGAAPPLIGWAAVRGSLSAEAWALYAILFLWQFPHFLAIAWMYREDYARGGMVMLSTIDPKGSATFRSIVVSTAALLPVSLLPWWLGVTGDLYLVGALLLGMAFLLSSVWAAAAKSTWRARTLLHASVAYLPFLFALLLLDRQVPFGG